MRAYGACFTCQLPLFAQSLSLRARFKPRVPVQQAACRTLQPMCGRSMLLAGTSTAQPHSMAFPAFTGLRCEVRWRCQSQAQSPGHQPGHAMTPPQLIGRTSLFTCSQSSDTCMPATATLCAMLRRSPSKVRKQTGEVSKRYILARFRCSSDQDLHETACLWASARSTVMTCP